MKSSTTGTAGPAQQAWAAFQARAPREKALLLAVLTALTLWVGDLLLTGPAWQARTLARQQAVRTEQALVERRAQLAATAQQQEQTRQREAGERAQLREQLSRLQARAPAPLDGARTLALLEALVARQQGRLQLVAMTALPDAAAAAAASASGSSTPVIYRHGLELVVAGPYEALHAYLRSLAELQALRVRGFELRVREHPQLELILQLETQSPQPAWLTL